MKKALKDLYVCPFSKGKLRLEETASSGDEISSGILAASENRYEIRDGIPDFTRKEKLTKLELDTQQEYDQVANQIYDAALDWLFESFYEKEPVERRVVYLIGDLDIRRGARLALRKLLRKRGKRKR